MLVDLWCGDNKFKLYGHISLWDTKHITKMVTYLTQQHLKSDISSGMVN